MWYYWAVQEAGGLLDIIEAAQPYIEAYGLGAVAAALFLETFFLTGLFFPAMLVVIAAAYFAADGMLAIEQVYLAGLGGAVLGDNLSFAAGRIAGSRLLQGRERLAGRVTAALAGKGLPLLLWYQYAPPVRPVVPLAAGYAHHPWARFAMLDSLGLAGWLAFMCACGYLAGGMLAGQGDMLSWVMRGIAFVATLGVVILVYTRVKQFNRSMLSAKPCKTVGSSVNG